MQTPAPPQTPAPIAAYLVDGDRVTPTEWSRGPWFDDQQHGAAVLALLTRFLERVPSRHPMRFTRITVDLSRAVPLEEMTVTAEALRDGRRVQSLVASIRVGDEVVSRAVASRMRVEPGLIPAELLLPPYPEDTAPLLGSEPLDYRTPGHNFHDCLDVRTSDHDPDGNTVTWFRLVQPVVAGEEATPTVRLAAVADMVMSSAMRLGKGWVSINPEVTLQFERLPVGEWICVESRVRFTDDGIGTSEAVLYDRERRVGRSAKSVLNHRP